MTAFYQQESIADVAAMIGTDEEQLVKSSGLSDRRRKPFESVEDVLNRPDFEWIVDELVPELSLGMIWAPPGALKSFVALDMACSLSTGSKVLGHFGAAKSKVAYISSEGGAGLKKRLAVWIGERGIVPADLKDLKISSHSYYLETEEEEDLLIDELKLAFAGNTPDVIIIDTLARNFAGDENSTKDMTRFTNKLADLIKHLRCIIILIHHCGKDVERGPRGNNSLVGAVDWHMQMSKPEAGDICTATVWKQKDGRDKWAFTMNVKEVELPPTQAVEGKPSRPQTSLYLTYTGETAFGGVKGTAEVTTQNIMPILKLCVDPQKRDDLVKSSGLDQGRVEKYLALAMGQGYLEKIDGNRTKANPNRWVLTPAGLGIVAHKEDKVSQSKSGKNDFPDLLD